MAAVGGRKAFDMAGGGYQVPGAWPAAAARPRSRSTAAEEAAQQLGVADSTVLFNACACAYEVAAP
jgi:hypothetical protein